MDDLLHDRSLNSGMTRFDAPGGLLNRLVTNSTFLRTLDIRRRRDFGSDTVSDVRRVHTRTSAPAPEPIIVAVELSFRRWSGKRDLWLTDAAVVGVLVDGVLQRRSVFFRPRRGLPPLARVPVVGETSLLVRSRLVNLRRD